MKDEHTIEVTGDGERGVVIVRVSRPDGSVAADLVLGWEEAIRFAVDLDHCGRYVRWLASKEQPR